MWSVIDAAVDVLAFAVVFFCVWQACSTYWRDEKYWKYGVIQLLIANFQLLILNFI